MSDRDNGLLSAIKNTFSKVKIAYCFRHMVANFKLKFKNRLLSRLLWKCAMTYEIFDAE
jgi:hypothetical protein